MHNFKVYILCFPRAASKHFNSILNSKLGNNRVLKTHDTWVNTKGKKIIGLIRNPLDQIISCMTQRFEFNKMLDDSLIPIETIVKKELSQTVIRYCRTMDAILDRASIIFDYDFLTSNTDLAVTAVLDMLEEVDLGLEVVVPKTNRDYRMHYLASSKESKHYDIIRSIVEDYDISAAEAKYQEVLAKAYRPADV